MTSLRVSVAELRRRVGTRRPCQRRVHVDIGEVAGTRVPGDAEIALDLVLESVLEGVIVAGTVTAPWSAACRRCLDPIEGAVEVEVRELFERDSTPGETYPLDDDQLDLEPLVRDAVLLALPLAPLCRPDCRGPDPARFPTTTEADDEPSAPPFDPRWAVLGELHFD